MSHNIPSSSKNDTSDSVQYWMHEVEVAADEAVSSVFNRKPMKKSIRDRDFVKMTVKHMRDHDSAYNEAQELLANWSAKTNLADDIGDDDDDYFVDKQNETQSFVDKFLKVIGLS